MSELNIGYENYITNATLGAGTTAPQMGVDNIKTAEIEFWQSAGLTDTITIDLGSALQIDMIGLHRISYDGTITVTAGSYSGVFTSSDYDGLEIFHIVDLPNVTEQNLTIAFTGGTIAPALGYVFIGSMKSFDVKSTARQDRDDSRDIVNNTEGGFISFGSRPFLRSYQMTINSEKTSQLKTKMRDFYIQGYALPRPMLFVCDKLEDEKALVAFDSGGISYDTLTSRKTGEFDSDTTIGLQEVIGWL